MEVGISMKVPLEKVADNLPPPQKPVPVTPSDRQISGYRGIGTHLQQWDDIAVETSTEVCTFVC